MRIASVAKRLANRAFGTVGYSLVRTVDAGAPTFHGALARLTGRAERIETVIDVGASNGSWSAALMHYLPDANYVLIEANAIHEPALVEFCKTRQNASYVVAAAGEQRGAIYFDATDPFGGLASETPLDSSSVRIPCASVDEIVADKGLDGPFLIKLDTHGFECPILRGAERVLAAAEVLVIECYNFRIAPECLLFYEMCQHLDSLGFRCIDLFDPMYRPSDHSFWQCDLVFVKKDRPEFEQCSYK